ncbi:putative disease resistance RPP13-like protein 1 [Mercurialis annua]|uniref:putative disease resistance RPP13-like protein 1 n=1 Tax=Mercurialis annua TaxID=3986 RepID=UPI0021600363|nr:putative disease resistance RPP13-like protein 1 [Mercurialis annua]
MAEALVGGAVLSSFLNVLFDRVSTREFIDYIKGRKINEALIKKLNTLIMAVNGVLDDAEEMQITKPAVKKWLDELKDAFYDADDLVDEISYKAFRYEMESSSRIEQVKSFFTDLNPLKKGMKERLVEVIERIDDLVKQKDVLGLREGIGEKLVKIPSTSVVDESGVYGRDKDREFVVKLLVNEGNVNEIDVIPIVGMGGVGKTTLAQLVYNDPRVVEFFEVKVWVCVSAEFDVFKVTRDVLKEITLENCDAKTPNQLQNEVKERLSGKRFLIVLDDVWSENYADWEVLQRPFKSGGLGSKIVITTRSHNVASIVRTVPTYYLDGLSNQDCWFLFAKHAFDDENFRICSDLEEYGKEIVRKCSGLPLAAKAMGGLLRSKKAVKDWEKISKSSLWNAPNDNILPALRLSYHYLPSHLKRCFSYCAIFPKDYEFEKEELILLWMAEGFLVDPSVDKEMEELGEEYFHDLVSRSLFQRSSGSRSSFNMHGLINELAKNVSGNFCCRLDGDDSSKVTKTTRHLSYVRIENDSAKKFEGIYEARSLRTFILVEWACIDNEVMQDLLFKFRKLRVLSLSQYRSVSELPQSIGYLKHLRYLDLSTASIKKLPEIMMILYNMQTLILHECTHLAVLPDTIGKLKNLRYLDLSGTSIQRLPESISELCNLQTLILLQCKDLIYLASNMENLVNLCRLDITGTKLQEMPPQIDQLKNLRILTNFIVSKDGGSNIKKLGELQHLQDKLCISNLENIIDVEDSSEANLKGKKHLKELELKWNDDPNDSDDSANDRDVLEQLQPYQNIECLSIVGYRDEAFPCWVGAESFSNIVSLKLNGCKKCSNLPPLGRLASLKDLAITEFGGIMVVGPEFYGGSASQINPFRSLKILKFEKMPQWREWISFESNDENRAFPLLQELYIRESPNLTTALPSHLPSLTTLEIDGCLQLVASLPSAPAIVKMKLKDDFRDVLLKKLPSGLHSLIVDKFYSLDSILDRMGSFFATLEEIEIRNHDSLKCFPLELFPRLKSLRITRCDVLESLFAAESTNLSFTSLFSLEIRECPNLVSLLRGRFPAPNLARLLLLGCSNVESFPGTELLPSTLTSLKIWDFQNLKNLDYTGLQHLTSLRELEICNCPKLVSLPEHGLPSTLSSLSIFLCPLLEQRCQKDRGEDWNKISHIRHVKVNFHKIS